MFFSLTLNASREKEYKNKSSDFPSCFGIIQVQNICIKSSRQIHLIEVMIIIIIIIIIVIIIIIIMTKLHFVEND